MGFVVVAFHALPKLHLLECQSTKAYVEILAVGY